MTVPSEHALDAQIALRDAILDLILSRRFIGSIPMSGMHAAVACVGAAAVMVALLPRPMRVRLADDLAASLPTLVDARADEIESGEFDDAMDRRQYDH